MISAEGSKLLATLAAVTCAAVVAGCGSSSLIAASSSSSGVSQGVRYADCMRANGVPNFPDPSEGSGIPLGTSPAFEAAQKACRHLLPDGGSVAPAIEAQKLQIFAIARCMRAHGVSGFPDPIGTPPASPAGYILIVGVRGAILAIPSTINPQSPAFKQAAAACQLPGFGRHT
ncbi:MAG: hypothetical protein ACLP01_25850 [Solirubrobacteraceae bacterium]